MHLHADNYQQGILVDDDWMAGVCHEATGYLAFVVSTTTGEYVGCHRFQTLGDALGAINRIPRPWRFEAYGKGCGGGRCGEGSCDPTQCSVGGCCG